MVTERVLHCIPTMGGGGAERQLCYLCRGLVELGWEVHVALLRGGPNIDRLMASGAQVHFIPPSRNDSPRIAGHLVRLVRQLKPDLVHTWIQMMDVWGGLASIIAGTPFVISQRIANTPTANTWKERIRRIIATRAGAIVSNSEAGQAYWDTHHRGKTLHQVITNPVPFDEIRGMQPISLAEFGLPRDGELVLYAGRFTEQKNLGDLTDALLLVLAERPGVYAALCGEGPLLPDVKARLSRERIGHRCLLPGYVPNIWVWMRRADVFVSVSRWEGRPNTVLEATAIGCPLVVSDIPTHREILHQDSARFVPLGQPAAIAEAIMDCLTGKQEARLRAMRAREAIQGWSVSAVASSYQALYTTVLAQAGRRPTLGRQVY